MGKSNKIAIFNSYVVYQRVYNHSDRGYIPTYGVCFWHAADTAPLEGLPILRCAIYDPLEGLQISKLMLAEMGV